MTKFVKTKHFFWRGNADFFDSYFIKRHESHINNYYHNEENFDYGNPSKKIKSSDFAYNTGLINR